MDNNYTEIHDILIAKREELEKQIADLERRIAKLRKKEPVIEEPEEEGIFAEEEPEKEIEVEGAGKAELETLEAEAEGGAATTPVTKETEVPEEGELPALFEEK